MFLDDLNLPVPDQDGVQRVSSRLVKTIGIVQKRTRRLSDKFKYFKSNCTEKKFALDS